MSRLTRSARGSLVDFDLLAIKQQIAAAPAPVSVDQRRKFIDEKDGLKSKVSSKLEIVDEPVNDSTHEALALAVDGAAQSSKKSKK